MYHIKGEAVKTLLWPVGIRPIEPQLDLQDGGVGGDKRGNRGKIKIFEKCRKWVSRFLERCLYAFEMIYGRF